MQLDSFTVREVLDNRTTTPHILPIYATSSFAFDSIDQGMEIFKNIESGHVYSRYANPTVDTVGKKIADMEAYGTGLELESVLTSSGMSAISTLVLGTMKTGDKLLTQENLYGGTTELFKAIFAPLGIETVFMDLKNYKAVEKTLKKDKKIKMLYLETPANPTLACLDISILSKLAFEADVFTAVDNTFCTPFLQQPFTLGADFVIHSTTKYLNGHGNSTAGVVIGKHKGIMRAQVWNAMKLLGTNCSPFEAWLTHNGMKTLALRMEKHSSNALALAKYLEKHPKVAKVNYPGLPKHPDYKLAKKQMPNGFGGMLSFELKGGLDAGIRCMNNLKFCTMAPTMGDVDTLILHPASMSHIKVPKEMREKNGISDGLIRVSVGIENVLDIIADLEQAMSF
jgi:methionine-gamma-lyase